MPEPRTIYTKQNHEVRKKINNSISHERPPSDWISQTEKYRSWQSIDDDNKRNETLPILLLILIVVGIVFSLLGWITYYWFKF
jgi:hypothetical protein